jgi:hypothetical protein
MITNDKNVNGSGIGAPVGAPKGGPRAPMPLTGGAILNGARAFCPKGALCPFLGSAGLMSFLGHWRPHSRGVHRGPAGWPIPAHWPGAPQAQQAPWILVGAPTGHWAPLGRHLGRHLGRRAEGLLGEPHPKDPNRSPSLLRHICIHICINRHSGHGFNGLNFLSELSHTQSLGSLSH